MDQAQISPGWAVFAILILWGVAGALDEPIEDTVPPEPPPAAETFRAIRLQCEVDDVAASGDVLTERRPIEVSLASFRIPARAPAPQPRRLPPTTLRCLVIDE
ncbi:hypothetical protein [uncultured Methylibium sp.]|uniref:hypothetical protein n=1 Tax=uncultured Methylibium sp. TaxID=381093 RepID=UPI0025FF2744|nr:hypothetical protein [uncultured Methylibium sp.]